MPSPQPAVLHGQPSPLSLPFFSEAACTPPRVSLAGPGAAFELQRHSSYYGKTTTAARGGGARGTVAMPPGGGWVLPCLRRAGPEPKKSSHVLIAGCPRVPPSAADPRAKTQLAEMATAEQLDAMSPVDRSQLVRCMQAPLPASAAASLHCSTQLASTQRAPLKRAPRSVLHSACDATISPTALTHT